MTTANSELASIGNDYNALLSKYKLFIMQWNELKQQPEIVEAIERIEKRKSRKRKRENDKKLSVNVMNRPDNQDFKAYLFAS